MQKKWGQISVPVTGRPVDPRTSDALFLVSELPGLWNPVLSSRWVMGVTGMRLLLCEVLCLIGRTSFKGRGLSWSATESGHVGVSLIVLRSRRP